MRRRNVVNGALVVAVAVLAGFAWFTTQRATGPAALTATAPDRVQELTVEFPRGEQPDLRLERGRDGWRLTAPIERAARDGRVVSALGVLAARSDACYAAADRRLSDFGLESPRLRLVAGDARVAFGDRTADGRRYVLADDRLCLIDDRAFPLLAQGIDGLASPTLLRPGARPTRIATPAAEARHESDAGWVFARGQGDGSAWADRWQGAHATGFTLDPPADDHGLIRVATDAGAIREWRIAAREPDVILVPPGADHGLELAPDHARALLIPPDPSEDEDEGEGGTANGRE